MPFVPQRETARTYTFFSRPRAVENRRRYREEPPHQIQNHYGNIMYDRRVVRGNTYARRILPTVENMAFVPQNEMAEICTFSSRDVENRSQYREEPPDQTQNHYGNIMYDRRVVRGNTYALQKKISATQAELDEIQRQQKQKQRKKAAVRRRAREQVRVGTPETQGRQHVEVQTELYQEKQSKVMESDVQCQTDAFLDKPDTPAKYGVDVATQIQDAEADKDNKEKTQR